MTIVFDPYARLAELGHELPVAKMRADWFEKAHQVGDLLFTSGQVSTKNGEPVARGRLGDEVDIEQGVASAAQAMVNVLGLVHDATGDLRLWRPVKITIFGAVTTDFNKLGDVATGASQLLVDVYGPVFGAHARTAATMPNPANGAAVEVEAIFQRR
jgi:enamine deaminase RidA (YjgF/YER057c/UK114 family)